jgi:hypothetical protein
LASGVGEWWRRSQDGDLGYRDALCELIGHAVTSAAETNDDGLVLRFDIGSLAIKPKLFEVLGPEIAMLQGFVDRPDWMVWRPGEPPFEDIE